MKYYMIYFSFSVFLCFSVQLQKYMDSAGESVVTLQALSQFSGLLCSKLVILIGLFSIHMYILLINRLSS